MGMWLSADQVWVVVSGLVICHRETVSKHASGGADRQADSQTCASKAECACSCWLRQIGPAAVVQRSLGT